MSELGVPPAPSMPVGFRVALAACILGMVAVAVWHPVEYLDGGFQRVAVGRQFILSPSEPGPGFRRLRLWRLCIEEGLLAAGAAVVVRAGRK
jgi:hypothetical protein